MSVKIEGETCAGPPHVLGGYIAYIALFEEPDTRVSAAWGGHVRAIVDRRDEHSSLPTGIGTRVRLGHDGENTDGDERNGNGHRLLACSR
jgi:hypothetical protein